MGSLKITLENIGDIADLITAITAVFAVIYAIYQTHKIREHQIEAVSRDHYQEFLRLSIEYPHFFCPEEERLDVDAMTFDGTREKFFQYEAYFWSALNALESLYYSLGKHKETWSATIASILDDQAKMLSSERVRGFADTFEPEFRDFLRPWLEGTAHGR